MSPLYLPRAGSGDLPFVETPTIESIPSFSRAFLQGQDACVKTNVDGSAKCRFIPVSLPAGFVLNKISFEADSVGSSGLLHSWCTIYGNSLGAATPFAYTPRAQTQDITSEWAAGATRDFIVCATGATGTPKPWVAEADQAYCILLGINVSGTQPKIKGIAHPSTFGAVQPNSGLSTSSFSAPTIASQIWTNIAADLIKPLMRIS